MKIKALAKVNLYLKVYKADESTFHPIETLVTLVKDFYDKIKIIKTNDNKDKIFCNIKKLEKENIIFTVLNYLRQEKLIKNFYKIELFKNIPIGSGLGGGTSNAISIYKFLIKKRTLELDEKIASIVGYDSYFFLSGFKTAKAEGYGEKIKKQPTKRQISKKDLILTNINCDTSLVYKMFDEIGHNNEINHLTKTVITLYPQLEKITKLGVMSGSGSTFVINNK